LRPKDQAGGAGLHRLIRLAQHGLLTGPLTAGDQFTLTTSAPSSLAMRAAWCTA
jgi:hypothetical protein